MVTKDREAIIDILLESIAETKRQIEGHKRELFSLGIIASALDDKYKAVLTEVTTEKE